MSAARPVLVFQTALLSDGSVRVGVEGQANPERVGLLLAKAAQVALNKMEQAATEPQIAVPNDQTARALLAAR
jgi:hypothetical protein